MNRAGRMERLGWIATTALGLGALAMMPACATTPRSEPVSTTATTASSYTPGSVELYVARQTSTGRPACGMYLAPTIEFPPGSAVIPPGESADLDRWAACLTRPQLDGVNVVLIAGEAAGAPEDLASMRAAQIKHALVQRGVDPSRIVLAPTNATREGGPFSSAAGVRIELTHLDEVRGYQTPRDPDIRRALR